MTRLSPSQVAHLLDNVPQKPVQRSSDTTGTRWGSYGGRAHLWEWRANRDSWFTLCLTPQFQTQKEPDGSQDNPCELCQAPIP